ncbi:MAG: response regulator transcription factor [Acidimicrobiales bacterium]|nr:response regulator transcription factor [Acidimicrobiales bacterium]
MVKTTSMVAHFTVALSDEPELVRAGLIELFHASCSPVEVVSGRRADIVLVDPFPPTLRSPAVALQKVHVARRSGAVVVAYTWDESLTNRILALRSGCSGFASKDWAGARLFNYLVGVVAHPEDFGSLIDLTARQIEIAQAVAAGRSNAEIAEAVLCSVETVKSELQSITVSKGLRNRAHLSSWVTATGLVHA